MITTWIFCLTESPDFILHFTLPLIRKKYTHIKMFQARPNLKVNQRTLKFELFF